MKRATKIWLIAAGALVLTGCILFAGVMSTLGWDFAKLSTVQYETNTHTVDAPFRDIALTTDTADIVLALSDDGKCRVECHEETNARHAVAVENGALTVRSQPSKRWFDFIGIHLGSPRITLYLPETAYNSLSVRESTGSITIPAAFAFDSAELSSSTGSAIFSASASDSLKIRTSTGSIRVENASVGSLELSVTTGDVTVSEVTCRSFTSGGSTGSILLEHVTVDGTLSIARSTGSVTFRRCDAAEISVRTNTGDVSGSLLTEKVFAASSHTGRIDVPQTTAGGRCEIRTDTGNIRITLD